jgi:hypothetical protein
LRFKVGYREIYPADCPGCTGPAKGLSVAPKIVSGSPLFTVSGIFMATAAAFYMQKMRSLQSCRANLKP